MSVQEGIRNVCALSVRSACRDAEEFQWGLATHVIIPEAEAASGFIWKPAEGHRHLSAGASGGCVIMLVSNTKRTVHR